MCRPLPWLVRTECGSPSAVLGSPRGWELREGQRGGDAQEHGWAAACPWRVPASQVALGWMGWDLAALWHRPIQIRSARSRPRVCPRQPQSPNPCAHSPLLSLHRPSPSAPAGHFHPQGAPASSIQSCLLAPVSCSFWSKSKTVFPLKMDRPCEWGIRPSAPS